MQTSIRANMMLRVRVFDVDITDKGKEKVLNDDSAGINAAKERMTEPTSSHPCSFYFPSLSLLIQIHLAPYLDKNRARRNHHDSWSARIN